LYFENKRESYNLQKEVTILKVRILETMVLITNKGSHFLRYLNIVFVPVRRLQIKS